MTVAHSAWEERLRARFEGKLVHVLGLGLFGGQVALARFLAGLGAQLCISDRKPAAALAPSMAALADLPGIEFALDDTMPPDRAADFDFVAPSPAVPPRSAHLAAARAAGVPAVTEAELFIECCPAPVTAVTGSAGKSTIVTLIGEMHRAEGHRVWVGGNLGISLLGDLRDIAASDVVVLELSSFQLERLPPGFPPFRVGIFASLFEHHLDWHGSLDAYVLAKERVFEGQVPGRDVALRDAPPVAEEATPLRGLIMRRNCGLAAAAARARGVGEPAIASALAGFRGLPHRFEEVARLPVPNGRDVVFVNASKATCPRTAASVLAVAEQPVFAILGGATFAPGFEEELDSLAWACARTQTRIALGPAADELLKMIPGTVRGDDLHGAVLALTQVAVNSGGGTVILAPGFPSYDQYANFEQRGEAFGAAVRQVLRERAGP